MSIQLPLRDQSVVLGFTTVEVDDSFGRMAGRMVCRVGTSGTLCSDRHRATPVTVS